MDHLLLLHSDDITYENVRFSHGFIRTKWRLSHDTYHKKFLIGFFLEQFGIHLEIVRKSNFLII